MDGTWEVLGKVKGKDGEFKVMIAWTDWKPNAGEI